MVLLRYQLAPVLGSHNDPSKLIILQTFQDFFEKFVEIQFQSLESLSDDSYINSLDEAISLKASIMHKKSLKNASPKSTNGTIISHLSINEEWARFSLI